MKFVTRAYNKVELNKLKGTVIKTSDDTRLVDEINVYRNIPAQLKHYFPSLVSSKTSFPLALELEYYPFQNLGQLAFEKDFVEQKWENVANCLSYLLQDFSKYEDKFYIMSKKENKECRHDMFVSKTEREYKNLTENFPFFKELITFDEIVINGIPYKNFNSIWNELKPFIKKEYCTKDTLVFYHGDLCFSNILCGFDKENNTALKLIDPRGSFGTSELYGDLYYDLAKLMHSVEGLYEHIIYDNFNLEIESTTNIKFSFWHHENMNKIKNIFDAVLFDTFDKLKIRMLEGLIYVGMCARHYDSHNRQIVMYCTGIRILNECLKEINA